MVTPKPVELSVQAPSFGKSAPAVAQTSTHAIVETSIPAVAPKSPVTVAVAQQTYALLMQWLWYIYVTGLFVFGLHLLLQLLVLFYQIQTHPVRKEGRYRIVEMSGNRAPCSFGPYIFVNPSLYDEETYYQILSHEKIHVAQSHSLDILLAEMGKVIQWFNPFAWMYRKAMDANLEFLTVASIVRNPTINVVQWP